MTHLRLVKVQSQIFTAKCSEPQVESSNAGMKEGASKTSEPTNRNLIRRTYKKTPLIIGGIEGSLRRMAHYDYWSGKVRRSILLDAGADLVSYGMGEHSIVEIANALRDGIPVRDITNIRERYSRPGMRNL